MTEDQPTVAEQLAVVLANHGLQRMTARVLAALIFVEQPAITMGELADRLHASSGAVSGAIRTLISVGLAERVPAPASRRDHYRLRDDAWAVLYTNQNEVIAAMRKAADAGIAATKPKKPSAATSHADARLLASVHRVSPCPRCSALSWQLGGNVANGCATT